MYYCQTRYYVPQWSRWLSADSPKYLDVDSPEGINLFAYCGNNPLMNMDPSGHAWYDVVGDWFRNHWKEVVIGAAFIIGGAIVTALTAGTGTAFWVAFGSALLTSAIQVGTGMAVGVAVNGVVNLCNGSNFFDNVGETLASSFMWGGIFSGGSQMLSGGLRWAQSAKHIRFKGIDTKYFGFLSPDKAYHPMPGATILRFGTRRGLKVALDIGRYGIHAHLLSGLHLWVIPELVGLIEFYRE